MVSLQASFLQVPERLVVFFFAHFLTGCCVMIGTALSGEKLKLHVICSNRYCN